MNNEKIKAEFRELLPSHGPECTCLLCDWSEPIESFLLQKLEEQREGFAQKLKEVKIKEKHNCSTMCGKHGCEYARTWDLVEDNPFNRGIDEAINLIKKD